MLTTLPVLFKFGLITSLAKLFGAPTGVALRTGLYLAQAGEFGFVLLSLAYDKQAAARQRAKSAAGLHGAVHAGHPVHHHVQQPHRDAPVVYRLADAIAGHDQDRIQVDQHRKACADLWLRPQRTEPGPPAAKERIPYMALDLDPDRVHQAAAAGQNVFFGDATRLQSLSAAGLSRAAAVVVTYPNTASARKILRHVHEHAPQVPVVVRTLDDASLDELQTAGATVVVPGAIEGSLMLASQALVLAGVPIRRVFRLVQDQRAARYGLLRGYFHGADDDSVDELELQRLSSVTLTQDSDCVGRVLGDILRTHELKVIIVSVRRASGAVVDPSDDLPCSRATPWSCPVGPKI